MENNETERDTGISKFDRPARRVYDSQSSSGQLRSESYFGRIKSFLGLTPAQARAEEMKMGVVRRDAKSDVLMIKKYGSEDFQPVSSQKFESPKEKK